MTGKTCVLCAASATHYCPQDDAFLCPGCNTTIHSANLLASRHKVLAISEFLQQGAKAEDAQSEAHSASPAAPLKEDAACNASPPESLTGTEGVVPVMASEHGNSNMAAPGGANTSGAEQPKWATDFDLFDLDNGWLDKLDCGFDLSGVFDDAQLVPDLMQVPDHAPAVHNTAAGNALGEVPFFPTSSASPSGFDALLPEVESHRPFSSTAVEQPHHAPQAKRPRLQQEAAGSNDDLDLLVPNCFNVGVPSFDLPTEVFDAAPPATLFQSASSNPNAAAATVATPTYQMPAPVVRVSAEQAALNRAERLTLYREKKKNRKFEKTIRYASRKAYAEVRPRIKGRFATPAEVAAMKAEAAARAAAAAAEEDAVVPCM